MRTDDQIKQEVEEFLLSGLAFKYILKSNPNLYRDKLELLFTDHDDDPAFNLAKINFNYEPSGIRFIGKPIIVRFPEDHAGNINYYDALYISDFEFSGFIYVSDTNQIELSLEATLRIFTRNSKVPKVNGWIVIPEIINVLDIDSFMVWERKEKSEEIKKLESLLHIKIEH